jgi:hypothetical protein
MYNEVQFARVYTYTKSDHKDEDTNKYKKVYINLINFFFQLYTDYQSSCYYTLYFQYLRTIMDYSEQTKKNGPGGACGTSGAQVQKGVLVGKAKEKRSLGKHRR